VPGKAGSAVFAVFSRKLSAGGVSSAAEILSFRRFGQQKNSKTLAVFSLFLAVFGAARRVTKSA
jgi:hypothetical protein